MDASETLGACLRDRCLGKRFQIHCRDLNGRWITLNHVASTTSVRMLKFMLHRKTRIPPEDCVLVYGSKLLTRQDARLKRHHEGRWVAGSRKAPRWCEH